MSGNDRRDEIFLRLKIDTGLFMVSECDLCSMWLGDVRWGSFLMWREIIFSTAYSYVGVYVVGTYSK